MLSSFGFQTSFSLALVIVNYFVQKLNPRLPVIYHKSMEFFVSHLSSFSLRRKCHCSFHFPLTFTLELIVGLAVKQTVSTRELMIPEQSSANYRFPSLLVGATLRHSLHYLTEFRGISSSCPLWYWLDNTLTGFLPVSL